MAQMVKISKTFTVTVSRFIEVHEDAYGFLDKNYIEEEMDSLEHDASMDLANIGQEQPFCTDYICIDDDFDLGKEC